MVFVGGSRGTSPSLDLTFPPTGLSENLGGMERGGEGNGKGKGGGDHAPALLPPTGFCLKYHPGPAYNISLVDYRQLPKVCRAT